jgi:hypothetical protein
LVLSIIRPGVRLMGSRRVDNVQPEQANAAGLKAIIGFMF